jgi:hypothetical protein
MDTVTMLRDLWRHWNAVVAVMALSVIVGVLVLYKFAGPLQLESRRYHVGVANTRVLIDTPSSQLAAIAPEGSADLGMRADLLSRIMVEGTVKAKIAEAAGLHPNALFGVSLTAADVSLTAADNLAAPIPPRGAPVLTTQVVVVNSSTQLPLIQIEAQAGDAASAARIANAAVKGLRDYIDEQAADTQVPDRRRVRVTPLGQTQAETALRGPKTVFALIAGIIVFGLGCVSIVGIAAVVRAWRRTSAAERWRPDEDVDPLVQAHAGAEEHEHEHVAPAGVSPLRHTEPVQTASVSRGAPGATAVGRGHAGRDRA